MNFIIKNVKTAPNPPRISTRINKYHKLILTTLVMLPIYVNKADSKIVPKIVASAKLENFMLVRPAAKLTTLKGAAIALRNIKTAIGPLSLRYCWYSPQILLLITEPNNLLPQNLET